MDNLNKERWIDEVMGSTSGMARAQPGHDLYDQVMLRLSRPVTISGSTFPLKQWAAAAILLLALNAGAIAYALDNKAHHNNNPNPLASEMQLGLTYNY